jgi:acetyl-CoA synthetase
MRWVTPELDAIDTTYAQLDRESNRVAQVLIGLELRPQDRVAVYLPKSPEVFFCILGIIKAGGIACPLFSNFGEDALLDRLGDSGTRFVITRKSLSRKLSKIWDQLPALAAVLLIDVEDDLEEKVLSLPCRLSQADGKFDPPITTPDMPSLLHYTSGSTGKPKGVLHHHQAASLIRRTGEEILQIHPGDLYWCTADQAWITGTSYGVFAPWLIGATQLQYGGAFSADIWCQILEKFKVKLWFTAPTALRMMIQQQEFIQRAYDYSALKWIFSVGEPLNPEVIKWGREFFQHDIHDTWFQTETGSIMIANRPGLEIRPGSMGKPVDGILPDILTEEGTPAEVGEQGYLCVTPGWDSMFSTYWNNDAAYQSKFKNGFYYTGDMATRDVDGYYWFVGRTDDVINSAGHLVSPFEVESALLEQAEVIDAGVIAVADDLLFEAVVAYITLRPEITWSRELELKLMRYVSNRVSTTACPREIIPVPKIPKNKSGKIMRRLLRSWYTGQDAGDISTMEEN